MEPTDRDSERRKAKQERLTERSPHTLSNIIRFITILRVLARWINVGGLTFHRDKYYKYRVSPSAIKKKHADANWRTKDCSVALSTNSPPRPQRLDRL